jgi:hypothetical protein
VKSTNHKSNVIDLSICNLDTPWPGL